MTNKFIYMSNNYLYDKYFYLHGKYLSAHRKIIFNEAMMSQRYPMREVVTSREFNDQIVTFSNF